MFQLSLRRAVCLIAFFMSGTTAFCQTDSLALSSGVTTPGSTVSLNLWLHAPSGSQPACIQWTFAYSPSDIVAISATAGVSATAAGKSLLCEGSAGSYACFLTGLGSGGLNANIIKNGVVVVLTVTLSAATSSTTINVTNALSTSPTGSAIQTTGWRDDHSYRNAQFDVAILQSAGRGPQRLRLLHSDLGPNRIRRNQRHAVRY